MLTLVIVLYVLCGFAAARVARKIFPVNVPAKLISETHADHCPRSPEFDIRYKILRGTGKYGKTRETSRCDGGYSCNTKYSNATNNHEKVLAVFAMWPVCVVLWLLLTERIIPKRQTEAERLQIEFDNNPELKRIHDELMATYRLEV